MYKFYSVNKRVMNTFNKFRNVYVKKGLELNRLKLKIYHNTFVSPYEISPNYTIGILTTYFVNLDEVLIVCGSGLVSSKNDFKIFDIVKKINSVIDCGEFGSFSHCDYDKTIFILYDTKIEGISQNMNLLDDVLTRYLNNCKKYYPLILTQCMSDKSPELIWDDFVKSSDDYKDRVE